MMSSELKTHYIEFFRKHNFNCFPIPPNTKIADFRYSAANTIPNQQISGEENYGVIPIKGAGNAIVDFDDKEKYRPFAEKTINDGYMVIESPNGWHLPVINLTGQVGKTELFDYNVQDKKIIEIQGGDHYCVGVESEITDNVKGIIKYQNRGSEKIWDAKGIDFHQFVDAICTICHVEARKKSSRSGYKYLRERFLAGEVPLKGSSNDYFHQAALQCNTEGLNRNEAMEKIKNIYHKWTTSPYFSGRPWSNIENKINQVYENGQKISLGRPEKEDDGIDTTEIAVQMIKSRKIFSNVETHEIFENCQGFLEKMNHTLKRELQAFYPDMEQHNYNSVLFKLEGLASPIPPTNKDLIVFKNGILNKKTKIIVETDEIADMGFKDFSYLQKTEENKPIEFIKIMFENVPEDEHPRIKIGLKSIFSSYLDPKISVIYGASGVGKSTPLTILSEILGSQYALTVELGQFLQDKFIKAKIMGKHLLVFQDLPKEWKDFTTLKTVTGEPRKTERGFMQDTITFENKLKIWASGNYLARIPEMEKDAMYTRRLSLIHNIRKEAYREDPMFAERVVRDEGEKIISWILNLDDSECKYESKDIVRKEWENISSPEIEYLEKNWRFSDSEGEVGIMRLIKDFQEKYQTSIDIEQMTKSLKAQGYVVKFNIIKNIEIIPETKPKGQNKL